MAPDYTPTWSLYPAEPRMCEGVRALADEITPEDAVLADILLFGANEGPARFCAYLAPQDEGDCSFGMPLVFRRRSKLRLFQAASSSQEARRTIGHGGSARYG